MPPQDTGPLPRHRMAVPTGVAYLDTAHASPLPIVAAEALAEDSREAAARGSLSLEERFARLAPLRASVAGVLGVGSDDVALVANTTHGMGLVAAGLDWRPGDVVLVPTADHPSTVLPWRAQAHRGVVVTPVPSAPGGSVLDALAGAVERTPSVRVVALSWVQAHDGERTDLAALAATVHDAGALLCVDAIQGAGVVPTALDDWGVDAAAAGSQKWLLGPHGIGALAVTPALRERLAPPWVSKGSLASGADGGPLVPVPSAARVEAGAPAHALVAGWAASLDLLAAAGTDAVWAWVDRLATRLADGAADLGLTVLSPRAASSRSALVTVAVPGVAADVVVEQLAAADVVVSARGAGVRLSPAAWTDDVEVDAALSALARL